MSKVLMKIWERADAHEPCFSGDEVAAWNDNLLAQLIDAGLVQQIESTSSVTCDACAEGHTEDISFIENPRHSPVRGYIYCPEHGWVHVPPYRQKQWTIDFNGLANTIAHTMDLASTVEEIVSGRVWALGKATIAAQSRELFLARGLTWNDVRNVLGASTRLNAARSPIVFAAGEVPPEDIWNGDAPPVVALKTVATLDKDGLTIDRSHLESLLSSGKKKTPTTPIVSFPTPAGTTWSDIRLTIMESELRVEAKGKRKTYTFQSAGFEERRKKNAPNRLWTLLNLFGKHGGILPYTAVDKKSQTNIKQYVSDLRQRLIALLPGIDGDLIAHDKDTKSYQTVFSVSCEDVLHFPTPPGAAWTDISIARHGEAGIRISATTTEVFAAPDYADEDDISTHEWVSAEREGTVERTYDLRTLKLTDDRNHLNQAGQALIDVLAGNGTTLRKSNDRGMLDLCGVLSKIMDIDGSPFEFAKTDEKWIALFDTSQSWKLGHA